MMMARGLRHFTRHARGQGMRADAAHFLVVAQREVDRLLERRLEELRQHGERDGVERLHVAGAATVVLAVLQGQRPGIGDPGLAVDRHHVGVARQHHAVLHVRSDRGEQVRLGAIFARHQIRGDAVTLQVALNVLDQCKVGIARGGVERHQATQHFDGIDDLSGQTKLQATENIGCERDRSWSGTRGASRHCREKRPACGWSPWRRRTCARRAWSCTGAPPR